MRALPPATLMWEAVASDTDALLAWANAVTADGLLRRETFVSGDGRVVLVTDWRDAAAARAADLTPPPGTCAREPHVWAFRRVASSEL